MIQPRAGRVLIQRIEDPPGLIQLTDLPKSIKGLVLAVGPGKWIPGEWWKFQKTGWEWIPGYRQQMTVKPGMKVLFNSKWNDFSHGELKGTGSDLAGPLERPLAIGADPMLHLVQEADIFSIVPDFNFKATVLPALLEREHMQNVEIQ